MTNNKKVISIIIFGAFSLLAIGISNLLAEAFKQFKDFLTLNNSIGSYSGKVLFGLIIGLIAWSISSLILKEKEHNLNSWFIFLIICLIIAILLVFTPFLHLIL